jgi:hypothetical protein
VADRVRADDPGELLALEVTVVRGVELLGGTPDALTLLSDPGVRESITGDALVLTADGRRVAVPSPSAWWLHEAPLLEGRCPVEVRLPGDDRLAAFFPVVATIPGVDDDLLRALGVRTTLDDWVSTPDGVDELLELLADEDVEVGGDLLVELCRVLADVDELPDPPERVRAVVDGETCVTDAADTVVAVAPHHALVLRLPYVPGTPRLAEVLDLETSDDARCGASHLTGGNQQPVPALHVRGRWPGVYREHDQLEVNGTDVEWWVRDDGEVHAVTLDGLARGLAWSSGRWESRFELAARLAQPVVEVVDRVERYYDA